MKNRYTPALIALTSLFFMWGLITSLNDILIPHLKALFDLSYVEAMLIQFCFFGAYFVMSFPSGYLVEKVGYRNGIVTGLAVAGVGCAAFYPAATAALLRAFSGRTLCTGVRHHAAAGRRQPLCRHPGRSANGSEPVEPHAGLQFGGHDGRPLGRGDHDPVGDVRRCRGDPDALPDSCRHVIRHCNRLLQAQPAADLCRHAAHGRRRHRSPQPQRLAVPPSGPRRGCHLCLCRRRGDHRQFPGQLHGPGQCRLDFPKAPRADTSPSTGAAPWWAASSARPS